MLFFVNTHFVRIIVPLHNKTITKINTMQIINQITSSEIKEILESCLTKSIDFSVEYEAEYFVIIETLLGVFRFEGIFNNESTECFHNSSPDSASYDRATLKITKAYQLDEDSDPHSLEFSQSEMNELSELVSEFINEK